MGTRDFSGEDIYDVLVNRGTFTHVRTTGDHLNLTWYSPEDHDIEERTVVIPLHERVSIGTRHDIASDAGTKEFDEFCAWTARHR